MKRYLSRLQLAVFGLAFGALSTSLGAQHSGSPQTPEVIALVHRSGVQGLSDANGRTFKEVWNLPSTIQLREETVAKLAQRLATHWVAKDGKNASCAPLLRPLLSDLGNNEMVLEVVELPQDTLSTTLLVHLEDAHRRVWQANWGRLLEGWTLRPELQTSRLAFVSTNSWFILHAVSGSGGGVDPDLQKNPWVKKVAAGERPLPEAPDQVLQLGANLARLATWLAVGKSEDFPKIDLTVTGRKEYLRSQARVTFREPLGIQLEKWDIPVNTIRDPLISFTAIQAIGSWLKRQPLIQQLGLDALPNQLYLWELSQTAFQIQAAVPVTAATNTLNRITEKWVPQFNRSLADHAVGNILRLTNRTELVWKGLPLLVPYLDTVREHGQDYLHAGIFPVDPSPSTAPPQLFQQITSQNNLVYYDWEITQARLTQLRPLLQLGAVFLTVAPMSTNSAASKWLDAVEPRLGNTVTEVSLASPKELQVVRTSHVGLTGLELLSLANWLEGTNFPRLNLDVRFRPAVRTNRPR